MDFDAEDSHADIREAVAAITRSFGDSYYAEHAVRQEPTEELWRELGRQGFMGINLPEEYGGGGAGLTELALVCEETAAQGAPLLLMLVSSAISGEVITRYGSEAQKKTWLPRMASGESKVVFAITEPDAGSNVVGENVEEALQAFLGPVPGNPQQPLHAVIDLIDQRQIVVAMLPLNLVHTDGLNVLQILMCYSPENRVFYGAKYVFPGRGERIRHLLPGEPLGPAGQEPAIRNRELVFAVGPRHLFHLHPAR